MDSGAEPIHFATVPAQAIAEMDILLTEPGALYSINRNNASFSIALPQNDTRDTFFIPIAFDPGWSAMVNDVSTPIYQTLGYFMAITLTEGINNIELSFSPVGLRLGVGISCVALVIVLLMTLPIFSKLHTMASSVNVPVQFKHVFVYVFYTIYAVMVLVVYIIPILLR